METKKGRLRRTRSFPNLKHIIAKKNTNYVQTKSIVGERKADEERNHIFEESKYQTLESVVMGVAMVCFCIHIHIYIYIFDRNGVSYVYKNLFECETSQVNCM